MILPHGVDGPALLLACALVGRVLIAVLPPGLPGRHAASELPATWAASHLLGGLALEVEAGLLRLLKLDPHAALFFAPWVLLALARWLTLPGAMVPRKDLPREASSPLALALFAAAPLAVAAAALFGPAHRFHDATLLATADALALLALAAHGLAAARRAPEWRSATLLLLAAALAAAIATMPAPPLRLVLAVGAGAALGIPWLRRADRRAGALALLAFASAALLGPREALFGLSGIVALRIHTAPPSRTSFTRFAAATFLPSAVLGWALHGTDLELESVLPATGALALVVIAAALSTRHRLVLARGGGDADTQRLGSAMLRDTLLLAAVPPITRGEIGSFDALALALLPILPIAVVEAGIVLGRAEIPGSAGVR